MLLNVLQCTGQHLSKQNDPAQLSTVLRCRNPAPCQSSSHVPEHLQRPILKHRGSPIDLSYANFQNFPSQVSPDKTVWRDVGEKKREEIILEMLPPSINDSHKEGIPDVGNLWSNRKT